jgi:hypothetical protein
MELVVREVVLTVQVVVSLVADGRPVFGETVLAPLAGRHSTRCKAQRPGMRQWIGGKVQQMKVNNP